VTAEPNPIVIRTTRRADFPGIIALTRAVYPASRPWSHAQLASHLAVFPEGQFVAVLESTGQIVGMAASLIIVWDDYRLHESWRDFTAAGTFTNHDPIHGRTLYGAEVMVHPEMQRRRIGKRLYRARRELVERIGLLRIRAGARLRGYSRYATRMTAEEYVLAILGGRLKDPTLSFQLREGFRVFAVVADYLKNDPDSLGYAALIEWLNPARATPKDNASRDTRFDIAPYRTPKTARATARRRESSGS
jgi:ribosomal protein S18 acetylase RimI-like enzyme